MVRKVFLFIDSSTAQYFIDEISKCSKDRPRFFAIAPPDSVDSNAG
jgi:hypothetical protein